MLGNGEGGGWGGWREGKGGGGGVREGKGGEGGVREGKGWGKGKGGEREGEGGRCAPVGWKLKGIGVARNGKGGRDFSEEISRESSMARKLCVGSPSSLPRDDKGKTNIPSA